MTNENQITIELRGEVGGPDFNCRMVTDALDGAGPVHVVIESGGGCSSSARLAPYLGQKTQHRHTGPHMLGPSQQLRPYG